MSQSPLDEPALGSRDALPPAGSAVGEVRERVRATGLLDDACALVAMLSGGRDSVCLLDVIVALRGPEHVHPLHVNYGLRPGADEDEEHCRGLCLQLGLELEVVRVQGHEREGNLHAWARELRYRAAEELARRLDGREGDDSGREGAREEGSARRAGESRQSAGGAGESRQGAGGAGESRQGAGGAGESRQGAGGAGARESDVSRSRLPRARARTRACIATGHTSTDQVETILYRLAASPGRRALLGMERHSGRLVRPLLDVSREQTAAYCRERGLVWREDPSNEDPGFARARVRHGLLEALQAVHPAAQENVLHTAELLREEDAYLRQLIDAELQGRDDIDIERLRALPAVLQRLLVIRLAELAAGAFVPRAGRRVDELLALAKRGGRAELHVGGLVSATVEHGRLRMHKIAPREQNPPRV
jgi:tRNA(Ile)-lysidine synthase TilS/MesJ